MPALSKPQLYKALVAAAQEFASLKPWEAFDNDQCLAFSIPGEEHPLFGSIMGQAGEELGLILLRGKDAKARLVEMLTSEHLDEDLTHELDYIGFSMTPLHEVPEEFRHVLRKAKVRFDRDLIVPFLSVKEKGRHLRSVDAADARVLLSVIKGFLATWERGMLKPVRLTEGAFLPMVTVTGDPLHPDIAVSTEDVSVEPRQTHGLAVMTPGELAELPRLDTRWAVGFPHVPAAIGDDPRSVRGVLVVDERTSTVLGMELVMGSDVPDAAAALFRICQGENVAGIRGLPKSAVITSSALHEALSPALERLGVACELDPDLPFMQEITGSLVRYMADESSEKDPRYSDVPGSSNLRGWKRVSESLTHRLVRLAGAAGLPDDKSRARYFGDKATADRILREYERHGAEVAFMEWLLYDHRPRRRGPTVAEQLQATGLPPAERTLLEAHINERPSFYRVVDVSVGDSLVMEDLLEGGTVRIHDVLLSECANDQICLPARVVKAGRFQFISPLGTFLPLQTVPQAMAHLEELGLETTREGLSRKAHLTGRLWPWMEDWERSAREMETVNFDGEPLSFHTASWSMADEQAVRRTLEKREDIDYHEEEDRYLWLVEGEQARMPGGGRVRAASITMVGGELILEVNSAGRLERARSWVDEIPGLAFVGSSELEAGEGGIPVLPPDDRTGPEERIRDPGSSPELAAALSEHMHKHYMEWLDAPIPALGGRTPRQVCRSKAGRRRVALMIRTIPDPGGIPGVTIPREEMLRELGID